jgi:hypothetical protein
MEMRTLLKRIGFSLGGIIILGYSYFAIKGYILGPQIYLESPPSGVGTTTPLTLVKGKVVHTSVLTLNDTPIPIDLEGNFSESVILAPGFNIITLKATDRYNRVVDKKIELALTVTPPPLSEPIATSTASTTLEISTTTEEIIKQTQ